MTRPPEPVPALAIAAPVIVSAPVAPPAMRLVSPPIRTYGRAVDGRQLLTDGLETPMRRCQCGAWYDSFWQFDLCPACDEEADA